MTSLPKTADKTTEPDDVDVLTIADFCRRHRLSVQMFYKRIDLMPTTFRIGARRYISVEAAARWRKEREKSAKRERQLVAS